MAETKTSSGIVVPTPTRMRPGEVPMFIAPSLPPGPIPREAGLPAAPTPMVEPGQVNLHGAPSAFAAQVLGLGEALPRRPELDDVTERESPPAAGPLIPVLFTVPGAGSIRVAYQVAEVNDDGAGMLLAAPDAPGSQSFIPEVNASLIVQIGDGELARRYKVISCGQIFRCLGWLLLVFPIQEELP